MMKLAPVKDAIRAAEGEKDDTNLGALSKATRLQGFQKRANNKDGREKSRRSSRTTGVSPSRSSSPSKKSKSMHRSRSMGEMDEQAKKQAIEHIKSKRRSSRHEEEGKSKSLSRTRSEGEEDKDDKQKAREFGKAKKSGSKDVKGETKDRSERKSSKSMHKSRSMGDMDEEAKKQALAHIKSKKEGSKNEESKGKPERKSSKSIHRSRSMGEMDEEEKKQALAHIKSKKEGSKDAKEETKEKPGRKSSKSIHRSRSMGEMDEEEKRQALAHVTSKKQVSRTASGDAKEKPERKSSKSIHRSRSMGEMDEEEKKQAVAQMKSKRQQGKDEGKETALPPRTSSKSKRQMRILGVETEENDDANKDTKGDTRRKKTESGGDGDSRPEKRDKAKASDDQGPDGESSAKESKRDEKTQRGERSSSKLSSKKHSSDPDLEKTKRRERSSSKNSLKMNPSDQALSKDAEADGKTRRRRTRDKSEDSSSPKMSASDGKLHSNAKKAMRRARSMDKTEAASRGSPQRISSTGRLPEMTALGYDAPPRRRFKEKTNVPRSKSTHARSMSMQLSEDSAMPGAARPKSTHRRRDGNKRTLTRSMSMSSVKDVKDEPADGELGPGPKDDTEPSTSPVNRSKSMGLGRKGDATERVSGELAEDKVKHSHGKSSHKRTHRRSLSMDDSGAHIDDDEVNPAAETQNRNSSKGKSTHRRPVRRVKSMDIMDVSIDDVEPTDEVIKRRAHRTSNNRLLIRGRSKRGLADAANAELRGSMHGRRPERSTHKRSTDAHVGIGRQRNRRNVSPRASIDVSPSRDRRKPSMGHGANSANTADETDNTTEPTKRNSTESSKRAHGRRQISSAMPSYMLGNVQLQQALQQSTHLDVDEDSEDEEVEARRAKRVQAFSLAGPIPKSEGGDSLESKSDHQPSTAASGLFSSFPSDSGVATTSIGGGLSSKSMRQSRSMFTSSDTGDESGTASMFGAFTTSAFTSSTFASFLSGQTDSTAPSKEDDDDEEGGTDDSHTKRLSSALRQRQSVAGATHSVSLSASSFHGRTMGSKEFSVSAAIPTRSSHRISQTKQNATGNSHNQALGSFVLPMAGKLKTANSDKKRNLSLAEKAQEAFSALSSRASKHNPPKQQLSASRHKRDADRIDPRSTRSADSHSKHLKTPSSSSFGNLNDLEDSDDDDGFAF